MIPKIIHYAWFSGEPYPPKVQECIDSWAKYLPDYKLKLWNIDAVKDIDSIFLQEALSVRKWAFAADFIRQWAVYNEGGIYLDTDVMVYKSFNESTLKTGKFTRSNQFEPFGVQFACRLK